MCSHSHCPLYRNAQEKHPYFSSEQLAQFNLYVHEGGLKPHSSKWAVTVH